MWSAPGGLGQRLAILADGVTLARKTHRIIRQNLGWALGYNLIAIPAAALGHVTPWIAGIQRDGAPRLRLRERHIARTQRE
ncbi:MAG: hypothetical protein R6W76_19445, partial [Caldilinea sp.]